MGNCELRRKEQKFGGGGYENGKISLKKTAAMKEYAKCMGRSNGSWSKRP